jgi:hypothetical protein
MTLSQNTVVEAAYDPAVPAQEAKNLESWHNTTSAWAGWSRFDTPLDSYGGVHSLLQCTGLFYLPLG